jgi:hypothetical protein
VFVCSAEDGLYKTELASSKKESLSKNCFYYVDITVHKDRIFYCENTGEGMYRFVSTDLSGKNRIEYFSSNSVDEVIYFLDGDWLYFSIPDPNHPTGGETNPFCLYKSKMDGTEFTMLAENIHGKYYNTKTKVFLKQGEWIYFILENPKVVCRVNEQTKEVQQLTEKEYEEIYFIHNGWLYMDYRTGRRIDERTLADWHELHRIRLDGSALEICCDSESCSDIVYTGDKVIFVSVRDIHDETHFAVLDLKTDKVTHYYDIDEDPRFIVQIGDWIYWTHYEGLEWTGRYKMNIDFESKPVELESDW